MQNVSDEKNTLFKSSVCPHWIIRTWKRLCKTPFTH